MSFQFTHPQWLWPLPFALAWLWWLAWTSEVQASPLRRWTACAVRGVIAAALLLALAGLQWRTPVEGMNVFFLLDRSDSIPAVQQEAACRWVASAAGLKQPTDRAGLIVFGSEASLESSAGIAINPHKLEAVVPTERTDIGSAIRLAVASFPEFGQRRIVLISDGRENLGDALGAAASARSLEVNVEVVPLGGERKTDVAIQRLQLPSQVKQGQTFEAKVFVQADEAGPASVRLYRNEHFLGQQTVRLEAGKNLFTFPQSLPESGFYSYDVRIEAANDRVPQNNRAFAFTQARDVPRVLLVSSDPVADAPLAEALRSPDLDLNVGAVNDFPASLPEIQSYDTIILNNVLAGDLTRDQLRLLEIAVRDFGTGFVCIGGDQAYAAGAYRGTPLAAILPVEVELSSKKVLPPGALVLVIDQSGSMTGEKLAMARQSAMAAVGALGPGDYAGVITFDGAPHVVADIQRVGDRRQLIRLINGIEAGGGTALYPPMVRAHALLRGVTASFKHCIILTDGISQPGDFEGITRAMVADRITVSTVGIGREIDGPLLQGIADAGKGRFYAVPSPDRLPQIFIKETAVVLKSAINEEPFLPRLVASTEPVRGIAAGTYPQLRGYVLTEPKPRAEVPLLTSRGDPLLAHWQIGLGRAVAFTSDARTRWAKDWIAWGHYRQFWRQVVQWSLRRLENADLTINVTTELGEGRLSVDALDEQGSYRNFLELRATVVAPTGAKQSVALRQTGPGHYEAAFPMRDAGAYLLNLMQMERGQVRAARIVGASLNHSPELSAAGPNLPLLRRIAEATGGKVLDASRPGSTPFYDDRRRTWQPHDLSESLLKLAILLFVLDVGIRRINPDPEEVRKAWNMAMRFVVFWRRAPVAAPPEQPLLAALLARREEIRLQQSARATWPEMAPSEDAPKPVRPLAAQAVRESPTPAAHPVSSEPGPPRSTTDRLLEAKRRARTRRG